MREGEKGERDMEEKGGGGDKDVKNAGLCC